MSAASLIVDTARGLAIAGAATLAARVLVAIATRRLVTVTLAGWVMVPALALGYAWAALPVPLLHGAATAPLLHLLLAALRLAPVAVVLAACIPPAPLDAAAIHCLRLAQRGRMRWREPAWRWWSAGPGRRWLATALAVFPLAFAEFELGSRLDVGVWSVRLFDAQAGGQPLATTLAQAAPGIAVQIATLAGAWLLLRRRGAQAGRAMGGAEPRWLVRAAWATFALGSMVLLAVPITMVASDAGGGFGAALAQATALRAELLASVVFAVVAAGCAWAIAGVVAGMRHGPPRHALTGAALAPGLCGSLVVGLTGLAAMQLPWLRPAADTPLPLALALVVLLLPYALLLRILTGRLRAGSAWRLAGLLAAGDAQQRRAASTLRWRLADGKRWWSMAWLFLWAYCDLAASAILHPVDMTPVLVRLYNLMHYGHSTALSVQLALALLVPALLIGVGFFLARLAHRCAAGRAATGDSGATAHG